MTESVEGLTAARTRLNKLRSAVADLDSRIARLEGQQRAADPADKLILAREIRELGDQRLTAGELLAEAEAQCATKEGEHEAAVQAAAKNLGGIASKLDDAARRFDRALSDAAAAIDEIEREAAPLENTLIQNGVRPRYTHARCITAAINRAFETRFGNAVKYVEKTSMSERIGQLVSEARQNAAHLRKKEAA